MEPLATFFIAINRRLLRSQELNAAIVPAELPVYSIYDYVLMAPAEPPVLKAISLKARILPVAIHYYQAFTPMEQSIRGNKSRIISFDISQTFISLQQHAAFMNPKLSLAIGIICIAFSPIFVKMAPVSALSAAFYRMFFAWVLLAPYCLKYTRLRIAPKSLLLAVIGGLVFAMDIAVWNISILKSTATISTLVANLAPVWVGILSLLILKKQPGISFWLGTLIAISGMCILVGIENLLKLQLNEGVVYAIASSVLYAIYILISKDVLNRIDPIVFMFYNMLAATIALGAYCLVNSDQLWGYTAHTWIILITLGIICQLIGWITINYAMSHMDPTRVSIALLGQTVATALLAWIILGEHVDFTELIGGVMVLTGIGVTFVKRKASAG